MYVHVLTIFTNNLISHAVYKNTKSQNTVKASENVNMK